MASFGEGARGSSALTSVDLFTGYSHFHQQTRLFVDWTLLASNSVFSLSGNTFISNDMFQPNSGNMVFPI